MKRKEWISLPVGTKFKMYKSIWEFINYEKVERIGTSFEFKRTCNEETEAERKTINQEHAKNGEWLKCLRHIRNTSNNHDCVICPFYIDNENGKMRWGTKHMRVIDIGQEVQVES